MSEQVSRRRALVQVATLGAAFVLPLSRSAGAQNAAKTRIEVYKEASCLCCQKWVDHMTAAGFDARVHNSGMDAIKAKHGVPGALQSCHTGLVDGFVIEGHVPAADVRKLLAQKPAGIVGLTIPGMPQSAPGMDLTPFQPYTVLTFDRKGATTVFARHDKA